MAEAFTELVLRLFALLRVTVEGFRMTSLSSVILSGAKNLHSCRPLAHKSQNDPLLDFLLKKTAIW